MRRGEQAEEDYMTRLMIVTAAVLALAGCETQNQTLAAGAVAGAAAGNVAAAATGGDRTVGTLVGAAVGLGTAGVITEQNKPKQCIFRHPDGTESRGDCPPGF